MFGRRMTYTVVASCPAVCRFRGPEQHTGVKLRVFASVSLCWAGPSPVLAVLLGLECALSVVASLVNVRETTRCAKEPPQRHRDHHPTCLATLFSALVVPLDWNA